MDSDDNKKDRKPVTNFSNCIGEAVTVYLKEADELGPLALPGKNGKVEARLVGVERPGVWIEPTSWRESAVSKEEDVPHVFLSWDNVLSMVRKVASREFAEKKQYRGLRPRA